MMQKHDVDILNSIYKNSRMAYDCTGMMNERCKNRELKSYLSAQQKHYARTCNAAKNMLEHSGEKVERVPKSHIKMAQMGIRMKTMRNKTASNVAEIMYKGTNMGIIDIAKTVNMSRSASENTKQLAETLLSNEERYANGLKRFL